MTNMKKCSLWTVAKNLSLVIIIFISLATLVSAQEVTAIKVNGKTIKIGETFDNVLTKIDNSYMTSQSSPTPDPSNPNSFMLTKKYDVRGNKFDLVVGRIEDPGPFRIIKIIKY